MSQNQEIIEAKLCGYIDGELDAQERAEIEKHLEANPQHRRLLESLKATRDLLKWLPREAAPSEVAETLNGQLERSVLLDEGTDSLHPGIWPRVFAAAAIILLTAGLGVAVYFTLPKSQKNAMPYAIHGTESAMPEAAPVPPEHRDDVVARRELDRTPMKSLDSGIASKAAAPADEKRVDLDRLAFGVSQNRDAIVAMANGRAAPANAGNNLLTGSTSNAMVMLVRSNSPQDAGKQITGYMDSQRIEWKQAEPAEQSILQPSVQKPEQLSQSQARQQASTQQALADAATIAPRIAAAQEQQQPGQRLAAATTQPWQFGQNNFNLTINEAAADMFVARMSRQQAVRLSNAISQDSAGKPELKELETALASSSTRPTTNAVNQPPASFHAMGGFGGTARGAGEQPTSRPAMEASVAKDSAPATQPASDIAALPDQPLDVVIVVESNANAPAEPATTQPATQPAATAGASPSPQTQPVPPGQ